MLLLLLMIVIMEKKQLEGWGPVASLAISTETSSRGGVASLAIPVEMACGGGGPFRYRRIFLLVQLFWCLPHNIVFYEKHAGVGAI